MTYGYARCFPQFDYESSQDRERQQIRLERLGADEIYCEYGSCSNDLYDILSVANEGDTIVTPEISILVRSTKELYEIIHLIKEGHLELVIGKVRIDCREDNNPVTDGMLKIAGIFSELEQYITRQKISSGMEKAKADGKALGRPQMTRETLPSLFLKYYHRYQMKEITQEKLAGLCGVTRQTIHKYIKIYREAENAEVKVYTKMESKRRMKTHRKARKRLKKIQDFAYEDLVILAKSEELDVMNYGVTEQTPATLELERRREEYREQEELEEQERLQAIKDLDLSVFDV